MPFDSATAIARWELIPIADIHLKGAPTQPMKPKGSITNLIAFSVVAFLILAMAIMNFTNLTAARATKRAKEMCVRKVVGATRRQLIGQILSETLLTVAVSLLLAITAAELILPSFNEVVGKELTIDLATDGSGLLLLLASTVGIAVLAGFYPAWMLTSFQPADVLHSQAAASNSGNKQRGILVISQFAASIMLIIATIVVYRQTNFMQTIDAGYRTEGIMIVHGLNSSDATGSPAAFKERLRQHQDVRSTALSAWVPAQGFNGGTRATMEGLAEPVVLTMRQIGFDYFKTYDVNPEAGRTLDRQYASDLIRTIDSDVNDGNVVINQRAANEFGFSTADEAVGKSFQMIADTSDPTKTIQATVVGVIPNLIERSAREEVSPTVYFVDESVFSKLSIYFETSNVSSFVTSIEKNWKQFAPNTPAQIDFVDERIANQYQGEAEASRIFAVFAALAIIISSLGLYGLASFSAENRTKEIGIRKVFGATTWIIVRLLTLQFSKPVLLANLIAWPVAWYFLNDWLGGFKFQIDLTIIPFLIACFATLFAAWITVGSKAFSVAQSKPVDALRQS